jgi:hypothetical protein
MKGLTTTIVPALALAGTALAQDVSVDFDKTANFGAAEPGRGRSKGRAAPSEPV